MHRKKIGSSEFSLGIVFYQWAVKIHKEVIESIPETVQLDNQMTEQQRQRTVIKILEWDSGKFWDF